jgi:hypothetical protein
MSNILRKLGTELQAIEQPLDLSIPENKLILAFYLAIRGVENDRRATNTLFGLCRVKTEERWIASTPLGYKNKTSKNETKYLEIEKSLAAFIPRSFIEIAKRTYNTEQIWKEAKRKGLICSKKSFWSMIRNPIYCGKIFIPKYKEEAHYVQGIHKPLASQELFYRVQDILDGRKKNQRRQILVDENLPLRGFFICLRKFAPRSEMVELNKAFIQNLYKNKSRENNKEFKDILVRFDELNNMISYFEHLDYAF